MPLSASRLMRFVAALATALAAVPTADAQTLGPYKWQLQPYCNVVTFTATVEAGGFRLAGTDDQCAASPAPASGRATLNADGTLAFAFTAIAADGNVVHTSARILSVALNGTWSDDAGGAGAFLPVLNSPLPGTPRPFAIGAGPLPANTVTSANIVDGTIGAADVDPAQVQRRIATPCPPGQFAQQVNADGSLTCAAVTGSAGGDITAVAAGSGLSGGGSTGDVTLSVAPGGIGATQLGAGAVTADKLAPDAVGAAALAPGAVGSQAVADGSLRAVDVDASQIQRRVITVCPSEQFLQSVSADGTAVCAGATPGSGITTLVAGTGLTGGGSAATVTLGVAPAGITGPLLATGAVSQAAIAPNAVDGSRIIDGSIGAADVNATQVQRRVVGTCAAGLYATAVDAAGALTCSDGTGTTSAILGEEAAFTAPSAAQIVAVGVDALRANGAAENTAVGYRAMTAHSTGGNNLAVGDSAMLVHVAGADNTAVGANALDSLSVGVGNIALGSGAGGLVVVGSNNIHIGHPGVIDDSATMRVGTTGTHTRLFAAGIVGTNITIGSQVFVSSDGQLGVFGSSERFKTDVADMGGQSRGLLRLRPVTFRYREGAVEGPDARQYGLVAEQVAEVYPELVTRDDEGRVNGVQYHKLAPMLLNEVQRQQREIDALKAQLAEVVRRLER